MRLLQHESALRFDSRIRSRVSLSLFNPCAFPDVLIPSGAKNLSAEQTHELHDDIERYLTLEVSEVNLDFWTVRFFFSAPVE